MKDKKIEKKGYKVANISGEKYIHEDTVNDIVIRAVKEAIEKYKEEQAKSILEKGSPEWLGFDTPDRKLSIKYEELLEDKE